MPKDPIIMEIQALPATLHTHVPPPNSHDTLKKLTLIVPSFAGRVDHHGTCMLGPIQHRKTTSPWQRRKQRWLVLYLSAKQQYSTGPSPSRPQHPRMLSALEKRRPNTYRLAHSHRQHDMGGRPTNRMLPVIAAIVTTSQQQGVMKSITLENRRSIWSPSGACP